MKSFELEQMWIEQGIAQGRREERINTLREKKRADRLERMLREIRRDMKKS